MVTSNPTFRDPKTKKKTTFTDDYPRLRLIERIIDARWPAVRDIDSLDRYHDQSLEKIRQDHATAFFAGLATYTPVP